VTTADVPPPPTTEEVRAWMDALPEGALAAMSRPSWIACNVTLVEVIRLDGSDTGHPATSRLATFSGIDGCIYALVART
jgi:hypothetical protein